MVAMAAVMMVFLYRNRPEKKNYDINDGDRVKNESIKKGLSASLLQRPYLWVYFPEFKFTLMSGCVITGQIDHFTVPFENCTFISDEAM